jgi:hypothetical protein
LLKVAGDVQAANAPPSRLHWYPGVPPEKLTVMLPVPPLHSGSALLDDVVTGVGWLTVAAAAEPVQPCASVILAG